MPTSTHTVSGMTCEHCAGAVRSEIGALAGVSRVQVAVDTGKVTIESTQDISRDAIANAVTEAGYELVD